MPPHTRRSDKCGSRRRFQYSIGDAPSRHRCRRQRRDFTLLSILHWRCQKGRRRVSPLYICFSNFQYSIGDANLLGRYNVLDCKDFQYSIGDAIEAFFTPPVTDSVTAFNTPLEMQTHLAGHLAKWLSDHFQYSIGDANVEQLKLLRLLYNRFQYSIGDAGGSCVWFLWVFKFLCWRVWVSCGGLLTVVVFGLVFVLVCWGWRCGCLRVFSPRRRLALRSCTTFYKLDLRFTYLTRRKS